MRKILLVLPAAALVLAGCTVTPPKPSPSHTATESHPATPRKATGKVLDGTYLVGTDLKAGTYTTPGPKSADISDSCYWERAKDDSGSLDSILANDVLTGRGRVTVHNREIFKLTGQCAWSLAK